MNERTIKMLIESGLLLNISEYRVQELDPKIKKLIELVVKECADIVASSSLPDAYSEPYLSVIAEEIKEHFGVDMNEKVIPIVNEEDNLHTCPYREEICNDYDTLCDCDEEQTMNCRMDI
jgi:hypothetical protein